jgi:hypothetical protein
MEKSKNKAVMGPNLGAMAMYESVSLFSRIARRSRCGNARWKRIMELVMGRGVVV